MPTRRPDARSHGRDTDLERLRQGDAERLTGTTAPEGLADRGHGDQVVAERVDEGEASERPPCASRRNPAFPLGVNYYPLDTEMQRWDDWYAGDVAADFAEFAAEHLTLVRVFISWKFFEPQVGQYSDTAEERLQLIVDTARAHNLRLIICLFADDRHAELLDVPWGRKRDPRTDPYLLERQLALVQRIVNRYRSEPAVMAWDLANEAFCGGFESRDELYAWVATVRGAIREVDPNSPVMLSIDPETFAHHARIDARSLLDEFEMGVSHVTSVYRGYAAEGPPTTVPFTYLDGFLLHMASREAPVLADDVGAHALDLSLHEEAISMRRALYSALVNRASGVMLRRWRDVVTERREPYFRDPFEVLVGVKDPEGLEKPSLLEVREFARAVARIDLSRYTRAQERVAIVVPSERFAPLPALAGLYAPRTCLHAYISATQAHVPVTVVHEDEPFDAFGVLVVASPFRLEEGTWARLTNFVKAGGSLICSYGGGDAHPVYRDVFGMEFLGDGGARKALACRVAQPGLLGDLLPFDVDSDVHAFALLGQAGAMVVATDATGSPLLTINQYGQGRAVLAAAPLERVLAQSDPCVAAGPVAHLVRTVYGAVAGAAGCGSSVRCDQPLVELALMPGEGDDIIVLLNHGNERLTATLAFDRVVSHIAHVRGGERTPVGHHSFGVPLERAGAVALRIGYE